jgi:pyruvate formate lyase activating enzyme
MKKAMFWEPRDQNKVQCNLCHHRCVIQPKRRGICGVRENRDGTLYSLVYGKLGAQAVDPIEKKPLYHFLPGSASLSIATRGCNFQCLHCQNCHLSQVSKEESFDREVFVSPEQVVQAAVACGCRSISYTYTEPTIFFEYVCDIARIAAENGLKNVLVTNGYITPEALRYGAPYVDAANIDLKFFLDEQYRKICGARLRPVLDTIELYRHLGIWIEITTLVIPTYNDSEDQLRGIAKFLVGLSVDIPWHVSAFHPTYKMENVPPTPPSILERAEEIGLEQGLKYVYPGNVNLRSDTRCPECQSVLIERGWFRVISNRLDGSKCPACGTEIAGLWV